MIVPMKKVCLMVQDKDRNEALVKLREIGVLHLDKISTHSDSHSVAVERKTRVEAAIGLIHHMKMPEKPKTPHSQGRERRIRLAPGQRRGRRLSDLLGTDDLEPYSLHAVNSPDRPQLADLMEKMGRDRKALHDRDTLLLREKSHIAPWGEFDPASIKQMASLGLPVFLYEITPEVFAAIPQDVRYIKLDSDKHIVRLMVFDKEILGIAPFPLPEKSLSALVEEEKEVKFNLDQLEEKIKTFADRRPALLKEMANVQQDIEFEAVMASMEKVEDVPPTLGFSYLTGFIPAEDMKQVKQAAAENRWALISDDPPPDVQVPTKLKNNKFVELLYPLTEFLEMVPGYNEVDISPWFLFFFLIFFGMIFGDAAYGIILFLIATVAMIKTSKSENGIPQAFKMMLFLSISNIAWGVLTCSWFGIDLALVPQVLKNISLSYFSEAKTDPAAVAKNLQLFCFSIALIHLTIAHIIGIIRQIKAKSLLIFAEIGNLAMLWGMFNVVLFLVIDSDRFPLLPVSLYVLGGGFVLTFIFASYQGSVLQSFLSSLKNILSVVLGVTSVFSDIMSYIRLWAVGLAGASIAAVVNSMAGPMLGSFLVFAGVILLVFGHGLNLVLNVLSVLVHGVRLNTLEFSGHVGLAWSGSLYRPFAEK